MTHVKLLRDAQAPDPGATTLAGFGTDELAASHRVLQGGPLVPVGQDDADKPPKPLRPRARTGERTLSRRAA